MKKSLAMLFILAFICSPACADTVREYTAWLEEVLPGAAFADTGIPPFVTDMLGSDYDFIARSDANYGSYIAGVRKDGAPELPADAHVSIAGTFETTVFRVQDDTGAIYYDFILADGVQMQAYDQLQHLIVHISETQEPSAPFEPRRSVIFQSADPQGHAQLAYAAEMEFSPENNDHPQLLMPIHNRETWKMGATQEPHYFCLNVDPPRNLLGEKYLEEEDLVRFTRIPIGLSLRDGENQYELVISESGVKGVETGNPHRLYQADPGYDALINLAEEKLGYRPGKADFLGKTSLRATLEWQGGSSVITEPNALRRLDEMFSEADFSVGSVKCPSPCFLTLEYSDGSSASMAVAINSFDLFFYRGMYFTAGNGKLLELFNLNPEDFYV